MISFSDQPSPNKPPYFTNCPIKKLEVYAEEGKANAKFPWQKLTAKDPEDGK